MTNSSEKEILRKVGLGVHKIKLNLQHNGGQVFQKLWCRDIRTRDNEENLPEGGYFQLADFVGFELSKKIELKANYKR